MDNTAMLLAVEVRLLAHHMHVAAREQHCDDIGIGAPWRDQERARWNTEHPVDEFLSVAYAEIKNVARVIADFETTLTI